MSIEKQLVKRSNSTCELCASTDNLAVYTVAPANEASEKDSIYICSTCSSQIDNPETMGANHWRCLNDSMWSTVPAVQVIAWRMLSRLKAEGWPQDLLDMLYLDEELQAWAEATGEGIDPDEMTVDDTGAPVAVEGKEVQPFKTICRELNIEHKHPGRGRLTLMFKAGRNKGATCGLSVFFQIWTAVVVGLFMGGAPFFFGLIFGFVDIIVFAILMSMLFSSAKIEITARDILITRKFMGFGRTKTMRLENLESIKPTTSMQSNNNHYYVLNFKGKDKQELEAGGMILGKSNAKRVIAEIMEVVRENE